jgi:hypothetical protein
MGVATFDRPIRRMSSASLIFGRKPGLKGTAPAGRQVAHGLATFAQLTFKNRASN